MSNTAEVINFPMKTEQAGGHMADLSNGYTRIANEIQKLKPRLRMSGREWQCLEAVIWLTYGWNKKQDRVTNTVISGLTGLSDSHVSDAIRSLAERGIIFSHKQGVMKMVGINTELSAWILDKPKTGKTFPKSGKVFPKTGKTFPETVDTQDYNNNNIKRSSSENSLEPSDDRLKRFLSAHPEAAIYTPNFTKWGTVADQQCAEWIIALLEKVKPFPKKPGLVAWANDVRLMRELDGHSHREICELFQWASRDAFWHTNILSPAKLRAKWDTLSLQREAAGRRTITSSSQVIDFNNTDWINEVFDGKTI
ncbi:replication protein [Salmonella enterica]|uniref:replication protein n=1 Tax=Citrobacter amalonaticus TaxID=35703 RepID=UPI0019044BFC|nr:replication protein [Citrobacter amalonaticus]ELM1462796.1 replication protein [Salmonella enterica]EMB4692665.1 replication protein [Citrobacter farmeri]EMB4694293.1 replication protein [Citrobacter farmeri]MBJ9325785.1 replication protein [Citrobacter amalonaticus]